MLFSKKYLHIMHLYDANKDEVRKHVRIEWKARARNIYVLLNTNSSIETKFDNVIKSNSVTLVVRSLADLSFY